MAFNNKIVKSYLDGVVSQVTLLERPISFGLVLFVNRCINGKLFFVVNYLFKTCIGFAFHHVLMTWAFYTRISELECVQTALQRYMVYNNHTVYEVMERNGHNLLTSFRRPGFSHALCDQARPPQCPYCGRGCIAQNRCYGKPLWHLTTAAFHAVYHSLENSQS